MSFLETCATSIDGSHSLFAQGYSYSLILKSNKTNKVIREKVDYSGHHAAGGFSHDGEKVLYLSFDHRGYSGPRVTVWDFKKDRIWTVESKHCPDHWGGMPHIYKDDLSMVLLGDIFGGVSLIRPYENRIVWHQEQAFGEKTRIESFLLSEEEELVWVSHKKGIGVLSLIDGKQISNHNHVDQTQPY
jgi:hypothetical protein